MNPYDELPKIAEYQKKLHNIAQNNLFIFGHCVFFSQAAYGQSILCYTMSKKGKDWRHI